MLKISVGIITHNKYYDNTKVLVHELKKQLIEIKELSVEIDIVVLNQAVMENEYVVEDFVKENKYIKNIYIKELKQPSVARNIILNNTCGDWIAFIDGDCLVSKDYLSNMINTIHLIDNREDIWMVQGAIWTIETSFFGKYEIISDIRSIFEISKKELGIYSFNKKNEKALKKFYTIKDQNMVNVVQGYNFIMRRTCGMFDGKINTAEDREIAYKVKQRGGCIVFCKDIMVYHPFDMSLQMILKRKEWHAIGCRKLYNKIGIENKKYTLRDIVKDVLQSRSLGYAIYALSTEFVFWREIYKY